ncbi:MAG: hypothetical protein IJ794_00960 [Lachnospiraceae bacterium]|nr:hypothetical protein [Lachnospiraceae bacterium]
MTDNHTIPYVFFDVDGVLNHESDWRGQRFFINSRCLSVFKDFVAFLEAKYHTDPILITCSTWRAGFDHKNNQNADAVSILEQKFRAVNLSIRGATPVSKKTRQEEIEYFIRRNDVRAYIVIDDDESLYNRPDEINLYVPDYRKGLTDKDLKQLKKQFVKYNEKIS